MPVHFTDSEPESPAEQVRFVGGTELRVEARVTNTGMCFLVQGDVEADLAMTCSRCLKDYSWHLRAPLHETYCPESDDQAFEGATEEAPDPFDDADDEETRSFSGSAFDLTEAVEQQIVLALPMKLLCSETCAGICPQCGVDRNESNCQCREDTTDPRLAALMEWQHRTGSGNNGKQS